MAPNDEFAPDTIDEQIEHLSRVPFQRTHPADHDDASLVQALRRIYQVPLSEADRTSLSRARQRIVDERTSDKTHSHEHTLQGQWGVSGSLQRHAEQRKRSIIVRVLSSLAAVIIVGALVLSWALVTHLAVHHQTTQTSTVPAPRASPKPSAPAPCQTGQLLLVAGQMTSNLGNAGVQLSFENRSRVTCTLTGYPTLQLLSAQQKPLQAQITRSTSGYLYRTRPPQMISLHPGQQAYFAVTWGNLGCGKIPPASYASPVSFLRVTPPLNQASLLVAVQFCAFGNQVAVSPVESSQVLGVFV